MRDITVNLSKPVVAMEIYYHLAVTRSRLIIRLPPVQVRKRLLEIYWRDLERWKWITKKHVLVLTASRSIDIRKHSTYSNASTMRGSVNIVTHVCGHEPLPIQSLLVHLSSCQ
jgi:hypothetical protein